MNQPPLTVTPPDPRPPFRHIAIVGPLGAGKRALAELLAQRWSMATLFEPARDNPFLEPFYRDTVRHALPVQLHFALTRAQLAREVGALAESGTAFVTDFLADKSELYARLTLAGDELALYRTLAAQLAVDAPAPELVVYLQASPELLFARLQKRAEPMELQIPDAYLRALCDSYNDFFYHYDHAPVLTVSAEYLNPPDSQADLALIVERIETMRGRKASFVKGASL